MAAKNTDAPQPSSRPEAGAQQEGVVRCCCGATADDGEMMVECERCLVWSHVHCLQRLAATSAYDLNLAAFVCPTCQPPTHSPFAHPMSDESLVDSLASYAKHPEGKVHGGSLAMFALAASSLGGSDDLFGELPALDDALELDSAMEPDAAPSWAALDALSAPRSCPDRPSRWSDAIKDNFCYGGGALAASLSHAPCMPSTLGRGGSPPSSLSYVSSADAYGMTPSSSINASSVLTNSSPAPSPIYSPIGKRGAHHSINPAIVRGGVTKVVGHAGLPRLDTALSTSTSTLEIMPKVGTRAIRCTTHCPSSGVAGIKPCRGKQPRLHHRVGTNHHGRRGAQRARHGALQRA